MEHTYWPTILHNLHNFDKTKRKVFDIFGGDFNWLNRKKEFMTASQLFQIPMQSVL